MRCRLRTLLIVLALGPPLLAGAWWGWFSSQIVDEMVSCNTDGSQCLLTYLRDGTIRSTPIRGPRR